MLYNIKFNFVRFIFSATQYNRYRSTFYLVFDFCEHDLAGLLSNVNVKFSLGEIKKVMQQLLNGLYYIHSNKVRGYIKHFIPFKTSNSKKLHVLLIEND